MPSTPAYPATIVAQSPDQFERVQLLSRLLVGIAIGVVHQSLAGLFGLLYLLLPIVAAVLVSRRGGAAYIERDSRWLISCLEWVVGLYAYMLFVTDRFPLEADNRAVRLHISPSGVPSVGSALTRLLTSVPHAFLLALLSIVSGVVALISAISILLTERCPEWARTFQRDLIGWIARLLSYHSSLVETYPPFLLSNGETKPPRRQEGLRV